MEAAYEAAWDDLATAQPWDPDGDGAAPDGTRSTRAGQSGTDDSGAEEPESEERPDAPR